MDSDSDSNTSVHNSRTAAFCSTTTIPLSSSPDDPQFERGPRGEQFLKKLLILERNQLAEDIIEACECLKAWWKKELIQQQKD
jgi:hypothetical protein